MMQYPVLAALLTASLGGFVLNSFSNMMQYPPLAALHPPVVVSY
jgi:hypothetical protein